MYIGLPVKNTLFLSDFNETWILSTIFEKNTHMKFHENPSSGSRVIPCGRTDVMKVIVAFRNFANTPKNALQPGSKSMLIYSAEPQPWTKQQCCNTCCGKFVDEYPTVAALMGQQYPSSYSVTEIVFSVVNVNVNLFLCVCKTIVDGCIRSYMRSWPRGFLSL